jgi:hypothetical protein
VTHTLHQMLLCTISLTNYIFYINISNVNNKNSFDLNVAHRQLIGCMKKLVVCNV